MNKIEKVLFTGKTRTVVSNPASTGHGNVDMNLSSPGTDKRNLSFNTVEPHPTAEQLFAGAWSACYITAIGLVAAQQRFQLPSDLSVEIEVDLGQTGNAWLLQARFDVRIPGVAQEVAEKLAHAAHEICPYSKATHGNINVVVTVTTA